MEKQYPNRNVHLPINTQRDLAKRVAYVFDWIQTFLGLSHSASSLIASALEECESDEREHRAFGARFTCGQARYRIPVKAASTLLAGRMFFCEAPTFITLPPTPYGVRGGVLTTLAGYTSVNRNLILAYAACMDADRPVIPQAEEKLNAPFKAVSIAIPGPDGVGYTAYLNPMELLREWDYALDAAVRS